MSLQTLCYSDTTVLETPTLNPLARVHQDISVQEEHLYQPSMSHLKATSQWRLTFFHESVQLELIKRYLLLFTVGCNLVLTTFQITFVSGGILVVFYQQNFTLDIHFLGVNNRINRGDKPVALRSNYNLEMLVFVEGEKREYLEKNPWSKDENQQQTRPKLTPIARTKPGPHWWEASAFTTAPSLVLL